MAIAAVTTIALIIKLQAQAATGSLGFGLVLAGRGGRRRDRRLRWPSSVEMTKMPELVAAMHSLIGLAAVCIAVAAVAEPWAFNIATRDSADSRSATGWNCSSAPSSAQ